MIEIRLPEQQKQNSAKAFERKKYLFHELTTACITILFSVLAHIFSSAISAYW